MGWTAMWGSFRWAPRLLHFSRETGRADLRRPPGRRRTRAPPPRPRRRARRRRPRSSTSSAGLVHVGGGALRAAGGQLALPPPGQHAAQAEAWPDVVAPAPRPPELAQ